MADDSSECRIALHVRGHALPALLLFSPSSTLASASIGLPPGIPTATLPWPAVFDALLGHALLLRPGALAEGDYAVLRYRDPAGTADGLLACPDHPNVVGPRAPLGTWAIRRPEPSRYEGRLVVYGDAGLPGLAALAAYDSHGGRLARPSKLAARR